LEMVITLFEQHLNTKLYYNTDGYYHI